MTRRQLLTISKPLTFLWEGRRDLRDATHSRYRDMQESRWGEIRIIMLTFWYYKGTT